MVVLAGCPVVCGGPERCREDILTAVNIRHSFKTKAEIGLVLDYFKPSTEAERKRSAGQVAGSVEKQQARRQQKAVPRKAVSPEAMQGDLARQMEGLQKMFKR